MRDEAHAHDLTIDGRFHVLQRIGAGGMAVVYRAVQLSLGREVAIKISHDRLPEHALERFRREAQVLAALDHPFVLRLIDFGALPDGRLYLVTPLLRGTTLEKVLTRGAISTARTTHILRQVCVALEYLHARGIVHRDLSPANIHLARGDRVTLIDFGIAHVAASARITLRGAVMGTPAYLAPEQARGEAVDAKSDLYSVGAIAYHCLAGKKVFAAPTAIETLIQLLEQKPQPLAGGDEPLNTLVMELLEKNPADRPPSAAVLRERLRRATRKKTLFERFLFVQLSAIW